MERRSESHIAGSNMGRQCQEKGRPCFQALAKIFVGCGRLCQVPQTELNKLKANVTDQAKKVSKCVNRTPNSLHEPNPLQLETEACTILTCKLT